MMRLVRRDLAVFRETNLGLEGGIELGRDAVDFQNKLLFVFLCPAMV